MSKITLNDTNSDSVQKLMEMAAQSSTAVLDAILFCPTATRLLHNADDLLVDDPQVIKLKLVIKNAN